MEINIYSVSMKQNKLGGVLSSSIVSFCALIRSASIFKEKENRGKNTWTARVTIAHFSTSGSAMDY